MRPNLAFINDQDLDMFGTRHGIERVQHEPDEPYRRRISLALHSGAKELEDVCTCGVWLSGINEPGPMHGTLCTKWRSE